ncbi:hypothetical protein ACFSHQ_09625 [Gemmobacter lanyuensis]
MMRRCAAAMARAGVVHLAYGVTQLTRQFDGVVLEAPGLRLHARKVVIAAGAHSRALAAQAGMPCRWIPSVAIMSNGIWRCRG